MEETKSLQNLQSLLDAMDKDRLGKKDFLNSFQKVLELVLKIEQKNSKAIDDLKNTYAMLLSSMENRHSSAYNDLKGQVDNVFVGKIVDKMKAEHNQRMTLADQKMASIKNGKDGTNGRNGVNGTNGKDFPIELYQKVSKDIEATKTDVKKAYEEARKPKNTISGMKKIVSYQTVDLSNSVDGETKSFTLPRKTIQVIDVRSSQFPFTFRKTVDWNLTGNSLIFTNAVTAIQPTQTLTALIEVGFYGK